MSPPRSAAQSSDAVDQTRWFAEDVQPHESALRSYLQASFPTVRDVDDIVQESYLRLVSARALYPIRSARAYLFGIARRLAVDLIRKERRTTAHEVVVDFGSLGVLDEKADAADTSSVHEEIALLAEAIHALPARCREVMILRKIERLSHREIARRLGISVSTVEVQLFRGMEKCTCFLRRRGMDVTRRKDAR